MKIFSILVSAFAGFLFTCEVGRAGPLWVVMTPEGLNGIAAPPQTYMSVPTGSSLIVTTIDAMDGMYLGNAVNYQWSKDGVAIPGATAGALQLPQVTAADSGHYEITPYFVTYPTTGYVGIHLNVVPRGHLGNTSSRLTLKAGNDIQIFGFVVSGHESKRMLVRVVGPTLGALDVPTPAVQPRLKLYDSQGHVFGTTPTTSPDWNDLFQKTGAFALTGGEDPNQTCSVQTFPPGAYTVHVSDAAAQGGNVLVEIYELP